MSDELKEAEVISIVGLDRKPKEEEPTDGVKELRANIEANKKRKEKLDAQRNGGNKSVCRNWKLPVK